MRCNDCLKMRYWHNTGRVGKHGRIIYQCTNCGREQENDPPQGLRLSYSAIYYDIEFCSTTVQYETFGLKNNQKWLDWKHITQPPYMLCWSVAKITPDTTQTNIRVKSGVLTGAEAKRGRDKRIVKDLRDWLNKFDYHIGHNIAGYDERKVQTQLIFNNLPGLHTPMIKKIDTLALVKKHFGTDSNSLGYWLQRLGLQSKDKMTREDWDLCKAGDCKALRKMVTYNRQDVRGGVQMFLELRDYLEGCGVRVFK